MKRFAGALLVFVLLTGVAASFGWDWFRNQVMNPGPLDAEKLVYIAPGTSTRGIAEMLAAEGVIGNDLLFRIEARLQRAKADLKAGEFQMTPHISIAEVISLLQSGRTYQRHITFAEGLLSFEIVDLLRKEETLTGDIVSMPLDGSLLPETYNFSHGDTRQSLIDRMMKAQDDAVAALWEKRPDGFRLTRDEMVVLASIVEKETGIAAERPRVAGVFLNRLQRGIPLQSDPTVIYALTLGQKALGRPLMLKDLKTPSPFNTYIASGLPPAPIANPGRAAMEAVINAEKNDFIYFVANGTGGHTFAKTLQEHNRNVTQWRKVQKSAK